MRYVLLATSSVSPPVYRQFRTYPCVLSANVKAFMPYLVGLAGMYYSAVKRPRKPTIVSSTETLRAGLNDVWKLVMTILHLIDSLSWMFWIIFAHVQHPKQLLKSVPSKYPTKERYLTRPTGAPVSLKLWQLYQPHIDDNSKKPFHFLCGCWLPVCEAGPWC